MTCGWQKGWDGDGQMECFRQRSLANHTTGRRSVAQSLAGPNSLGLARHSSSYSMMTMTMAMTIVIVIVIVIPVVVATAQATDEEVPTRNRSSGGTERNLALTAAVPDEGYGRRPELRHHTAKPRVRRALETCGFTPDC